MSSHEFFMGVNPAYDFLHGGEMCQSFRFRTDKNYVNIPINDDHGFYNVTVRCGERSDSDFKITIADNNDSFYYTRGIFNQSGFKDMTYREIFDMARDRCMAIDTKRSLKPFIVYKPIKNEESEYGYTQTARNTMKSAYHGAVIVEQIKYQLSNQIMSIQPYEDKAYPQLRYSIWVDDISATVAFDDNYTIVKVHVADPKIHDVVYKYTTSK